MLQPLTFESEREQVAVNSVFGNLQEQAQEPHEEFLQEPIKHNKLQQELWEASSFQILNKAKRIEIDVKAFYTKSENFYELPQIWTEDGNDF